jgi:hypothetical protein
MAWRRYISITTPNSAATPASAIKPVPVATDTLPGDEPIDICQVKKGEKGISHFITEHITPFYERRWGGFLRDLKTTRII